MTAEVATTDSGSKVKLSKRQKRMQGSEKNKWPQHPKIQNMEQRNKAYLHVAGLGVSSKKQPKETIDPKLELMSPEVKFGRLLGATDTRKRHMAVHKLKAYLKARCDIANEQGGLSELELLKLWKGLWFTLYMADKVPVQDELSHRLAELLWCVAGTEEEDEYAGQAYMEVCKAEDEKEEEESGDDDDDVVLEEIENTLEQRDSDESSENSSEDDGEEEEEEEESMNDGGKLDDKEELDDLEVPHCRGAHLASLFIRTFFRTIRREWGKMDKYRVDKFYTLIRLYMHEIFKYMAARHWNYGIIRLFNDAVFDEVLNQTPNGLRCHLIDISLEELSKVNAKAPLPLTEATFLDTLEPYISMSQTGAGSDTVQERVMDKVFGKFLEEYSVISDKAHAEKSDDDDGDGDENHERLVFDEVHVGTVSKFLFELASDSETKDQYRKSLYDMHKRYARRLKKVGRDVELNEELGEGEGYENDEDYMVDELVDEQNAQIMMEEVSEVELQAYQMQSSHKPTDNKKKRKKERKNQENLSESKGGDKNRSRNAEKSKKRQRLEGGEEEVVISLSDQKIARRDARAKKEKKTKENPKPADTQLPQSDSKRVKFTANRSKSFKASMKALVSVDLPKTSELTPEKGILRNKERSSPATTNQKKGRKKAVHYF